MHAEAWHLRGAVVVPGIVRAAVAPLRVARRSRSFPQRIERPRIVALELAHLHHTRSRLRVSQAHRIVVEHSVSAFRLKQ